MQFTKLLPQGLLSDTETLHLKEYRFVKYFFLLLLIFSLYHLFIWFIWTSKIFDAAPYYVGDLSRLGYQVDSIQARQTENSLAQHHLNKHSYNGQKIDLITLGDSFSNGMSGGSNAYYQDFIASENNLTVLNIQNIKQSYNYIETISILHNSGWLKKVRPKAVLIESVQREMLVRFDRPVRWELSLSLEEAEKNLFNRGWKPLVPPLKPLNTANYKFPYYSLLYQYSENAFGKNQVYKFALEKEFFSADAPKTLLVYKEDVQRLLQPTEKNMQRMNAHFNRLALLLKEDGIELYVMPAVDKYDLYAPYISSNKHPENSFFKRLIPLSKEYTLVNTKEILSPLVAQGTKDVFYADDTHWGPIASRHIARSLYFKKLQHE